MCITLIQRRRTVRKFTDRPLEKETVDRIIEAALRSPSSRSLRPWEFVIVTDRDILDNLSRAKHHGAGFLRDAVAGFVVLADPEQCDVWIEDAAIASIIIQLAAESLGLGTCWIQIRNRMHGDAVTAGEYIAKLLNIPPHIQVESIIALGYPAEEKKPHGTHTLRYEKVHHNRYGSDYHDA